MNLIKIGTAFLPDSSCEFKVWAPYADHLELKFTSPVCRTLSMTRAGCGYWSTTVKGIRPGFRYYYIVNGVLRRPDPASFSQPEGVHGPSEIIAHKEFRWSDTLWKPPPLEKMIFYEIHTGTFTPEGTFDAIIPKLQELKDTGITTIELLPVAQFPGNRNWGYDGVYPYAVQNSYGGPSGLKRLCDACHKTGLSLFLDVVYNHLGPEGNYLHAFGPYFTDRYRSPWGETVNYDGEQSDGVRNYFIMNALFWFKNYRIDGLRLDAIHGIFDLSAKHILEELDDAVKSLAKSEGKIFYLVAESDLNDSRIVKDKKHGGYGLDAQWSDDFHHSIHTLLTGERTRHYCDFGNIDHIKKAITEGFVYSGGYSEYRKRSHGNSCSDVPGKKMIIFIQNHDQIGNRMSGERFTELAGFEAHKLAAGTMFASPYIPLLFMGEEYAETAPFLYFVSHGDPGLVEGVRHGRKREFEFYGKDREPPDPQSPETFKKSITDRIQITREPHTTMLRYYKELISIRKNTPAIRKLTKKHLFAEIAGDGKIIILRREYADSKIYAVMNFSSGINSCRIGEKNCMMQKKIDSADRSWNGPGASAPSVINKKRKIDLMPFNFILYSASGSS